MKNIHLYFLLFVSSYSFACSDILDTEMRVLDSSDTVNLCEYEDQVVMVVNVASRCGYTYQYASLQNLYDCLLYTSPSPRDTERSRMPSSA